MEPKFKWDLNSIKRIRKNMKTLAGKSSRIIGIAGENMRYAPDVEFGYRRLPPHRMAHMQPAFVEWTPKVKALIESKVSAEFKKINENSISDGTVDLFLHKIVVAAMFELEALRVKWLRFAIYTALRWQMNPEMSYKLTQNLMNNRTIDVLADNNVKHQRWKKKDLPKLDTRQ